MADDTWLVVNGDRWKTRYSGERRRQKVHRLRAGLGEGLESACGSLLRLTDDEIVRLDTEVIAALALSMCGARACQG